MRSTGGLATLWRIGAVFLWSLFLLVWLLTSLIGQDWEHTAKLVYLPPIVGPLVLLVYALPGWWWGRRWLVMLSLTALTVLGPGLGWRKHEGRPSTRNSDEGNVLRVMTVNRGQHHGHDIDFFLMETLPDVLAIQDGFTPVAYPAGAAGLRGLPHVVRNGEFVLVSRFPVKDTKMLKLTVQREDGSSRTWFHSARYLLQTNVGEVVVYNVHLPSPRFALTGKKGPPAVTENYWEFQGHVLDELLAHIEAETLPTVALGDWNLPALGPRYRKMVKRLTDAHLVAGKGYGFTAPGDVKHWLAFHQPWLRLDYALASRHWDVERCVTEPASDSQHAAVFAQLRLR